MKNNIREILDKTDIYVLDEINILEYIDELEKVKEDYNELEGISKKELLKRLERSTSETIDYYNRINKAIEYIEDNNNYEEGYCDGELMIYKRNLKGLLDILRGEDSVKD